MERWEGTSTRVRKLSSLTELRGFLTKTLPQVTSKGKSPPTFSEKRCFRLEWYKWDGSNRNFFFLLLRFFFLNLSYLKTYKTINQGILKTWKISLVSSSPFESKRWTVWRNWKTDWKLVNRAPFRKRIISHSCTGPINRESGQGKLG